MKTRKLISLFLCAVLAVGLLAGCGTTTDKPADKPADGVEPAAESVYRLLYSGEFTTLNYYATGNTHEYKVLANCVDALLEYDKYGIARPALAETWEHNADYTEWTFHLRRGVKWVDYTGAEVAEVTAYDFVTAAEWVNDAHNDSGVQYSYTDVLNADNFYESTASQLEAENAVTDGKAATVEAYYAENGIDAAAFTTFEDVGVKATDDYTLIYTTTGPCTYFESMVTYVAFLPVSQAFLDEQGENFGQDNETLLYCGAYLLSEYEPQGHRTLVKNPTYWDIGNVTIDRVQYTYNADDITISPTMYKNGEVDYAQIGTDILDDWYSDPVTKEFVHPTTPVRSFSYFFPFNFEPRFDAKYNPANWTIAVNNENFRQSLFHALDAKKALAVQDPYAPETLVSKGLTPFNIAGVGDKDYTEFGDLATVRAAEYFDETLAKQYRDTAKTELTAAGATFPVIVYMPYNPTILDWEKQCVVIEQQMEGLLGSDYIDIVVEAGPTEGFLGATRRNGNYAFNRCNWGADYADPQTFTDPFASGNTYNFMYTDANKVLGDIPATNKTAETQALVTEYFRLLDEAKASKTDILDRYEKFANAEAFLIKHALVVPFSVDTDGYLADDINPFTRPDAAFGVSPFLYKGAELMAKSFSADEFVAARTQWELERDAAKAAAARG
ncbi:MAG: peptide ABC transporter substrate-binding protein [Oscillospiraceae bacterium]|jgi:oligopeptide transport system substrate-binding protein|nr:peptide ABC transporter substrate-binding protein [Oscillospiraceae bacterium]